MTDDNAHDHDARAEGFVTSLPEPADHSSGPAGPDRSDTYARLGMIVMVIGLAVAVIAVVMSQTSDNPLDQSTQISMGIAGVAAVCFGGVLFLRYSFGRLLRFWLLRMLHERHSGDRG